MYQCEGDDCFILVSDPGERLCLKCRTAKIQAPTIVSAEVDEDLGDILGEIKGTFPAGPVVQTTIDVSRGYLPFSSTCGVIHGWVIQAQPQVLFKGEALMLWGFDDSTIINGLYVGNFMQGAATIGPIPASFFGTAKSYEKLVEDFAKNGISPPSWITWKTCTLGNLISIRGDGPLSHAILLGKLAY